MVCMCERELLLETQMRSASLCDESNHAVVHVGDAVGRHDVARAEREGLALAVRDLAAGLCHQKRTRSDVP